MGIWHGFILIEKPPVLSGGEWFDILTSLRDVWDFLSDDWDLSKRLRWRFSLAGTAVLIASAFNAEDIDIENLARLPAYIQSIVPRFTVAQVRDAMRDYITLFGGKNGDYAASFQAMRDYMLEHLSVWEVDY